MAETVASITHTHGIQGIDLPSLHVAVVLTLEDLLGVGRAMGTGHVGSE
jgi:hypothetical protein